MDWEAKHDEITASAQEYLRGLLAKQEHDGTGVRIFVSRPGTPYAETCLAYCRPGEQKPDDKEFPYEGFSAWIEAASIPFLEEARIDYQADRLGGQLSIKAPNAKMPKVDPDCPWPSELLMCCNPRLIPGWPLTWGSDLDRADRRARCGLQFGGGCQGCSAVDMTLKMASSAHCSSKSLSSKASGTSRITAIHPTRTTVNDSRTRDHSGD